MAETKRNPGEGERAARLGYVLQDVASAHLIHAAIRQRELRWIGLADRAAGVADDLVLGLNDTIIGHQFKNSNSPQPIGLVGLLLGTSNYIAELATSYTMLQEQFPQQRVTIRFFSPDTASINDHQIKGDSASHTDNFLRDAWSYRTIENMRTSKWRSVFEDLLSASGLAEHNFVRFWQSLDIRLGANAELAFLAPDDEDAKLEIAEISKEIPSLIVNDPKRDRWTRAELLAYLGWSDPFKVRYSHAFPIGEFVQENSQTETALLNALTSHDTGYIGLVGSPGSGKSTLLQNALRDSPQVRVVRYLAYMPGAALGQGRGEAESMLRDVAAGLADAGLNLVQLKDRTLQGELRRFESLLSQAAAEHQRTGVRYVIVIDGLDHVPREERPERSLLGFLPLPQTLPDGVLIVLGTQRLDLSDMPPAVREQASEVGRRVEIAPLDIHAVSNMADQAGVDEEVLRETIYEITAGHPLVSMYFIKRISSADEETRKGLLDGQHGFDGDLEKIYTSAWRGIEALSEHADVHRVLSLIGHAEGPIEPKCLEDLTSNSRAVESVYREAAHLLEISETGWTTFHNSFRLFLQSKPVQKYGSADPAYTPENLYRSLATATDTASDFSPQRWLKFRYLLLAGDLTTALSIGKRQYFVAQFCETRRSSEICNDIDSAISALRECATATELFELILTRDEIERRTDVMEGAPSLSRAYLSLGDLVKATSALSEAYTEGDQWPVIDALIDEGSGSEARRLFDHHSPYRRADDFGNYTQAEGLPWASRAIQFFSPAQLQRLLVIPPEASSEGEQTGVQDTAETVRSIRYDVARGWCREGGGKLKLA